MAKPVLLNANGSFDPVGCLLIIKKPVKVSILSIRDNTQPSFVWGNVSKIPFGL